MRYVLFLCLFFLAAPVHATTLEEADKSAVRIMAYFTVGRDDIPATNVTTDQFASHLAELASGDYHVMALPDVLKAYKANTPLPENAVAITFDGGDKSVLTNAAPLLERYGFPYTVFIATGHADTLFPNHLNWRDIKTLHKTGLANFGLHPESYTNLSGKPLETIRSQLNNATVRFRNEMGFNAGLFAYPFGEYDENYHETVSAYGFQGAFGQQSGVAYNGHDVFALPRFTMTENYANIDRFQMTANALPLPVTDMTPAYSHIYKSQPSVGFTAPELLGKLNRLSCFASGQEKPEINIVGKNRIEIRLAQSIDESRFRLNCTLPAEAGNSNETKRWRWLGALLTVDEAVLQPAEITAQEGDS